MKYFSNHEQDGTCSYVQLGNEIKIILITCSILLNSEKWLAVFVFRSVRVPIISIEIFSFRVIQTQRG